MPDSAATSFWWQLGSGTTLQSQQPAVDAEKCYEFQKKRKKRRKKRPQKFALPTPLLKLT